MNVPGWLAALFLGATAFVIGVILQLTGSSHTGLAISMVGSMVGSMVAVGGILCRPRGSH